MVYRRFGLRSAVIEKKEIGQAVSRQLKIVAHSTLLGISNVPAVLLAEYLVWIAPPKLSKVFTRIVVQRPYK